MQGLKGTGDPRGWADRRFIPLKTRWRYEEAVPATGPDTAAPEVLSSPVPVVPSTKKQPHVWVEVSRQKLRAALNASRRQAGEQAGCQRERLSQAGGARGMAATRSDGGGDIAVCRRSRCVPLRTALPQLDPARDGSPSLSESWGIGGRRRQWSSVLRELGST